MPYLESTILHIMGRVPLSSLWLAGHSVELVDGRPSLSGLTVQGPLFSQEMVESLLVCKTRSPFRDAEGALQFHNPCGLHPGALAGGMKE